MGINTNTQMSKLTALNGMASYIGIPPLEQISEVSLSPDFQLAELILDELVQEVCAHGMPCNTQINYEMIPDENNEILLEPGMISAFPEDRWSDLIVEQDGKLYNVQDNTTEFSQPITATVFWLYDFESLPQVVRKYVYVDASRRFISRVKGDDAVLATTQLDQLRAETEFLSYTQQIGKVNMIYDNPETCYAIDNNSANLGYGYYGY